MDDQWAGIKNYLLSYWLLKKDLKDDLTHSASKQYKEKSLSLPWAVYLSWQRGGSTFHRPPIKDEKKLMEWTASRERNL